MSRTLAFICKNSREELIKKVTPIAYKYSLLTDSDEDYFDFLDEQNELRPITISEEKFPNLDDGQLDITLHGEFYFAEQVYKKKILKDNIKNYFGYFMYIHSDLSNVDKILCQLDDVYTMDNQPRIIVYDDIKQQVIDSNYQLEWFWNDDKFCVKLPDDWEEYYDDVYDAYDISGFFKE